MIIISDFSDTIATSASGQKFPPFELELGKIVAADKLTKTPDVEKFINANTQTYEDFLKVRRDISMPFNDRMKVWLKPFTLYLEPKHIDTLVASFQLNPNYLEVTRLLKNAFNLKTLNITIASGTLWQIISSFLSKESIKNQLSNENIKFDIKAAKLIFQNNVFSGELEYTDPIAYAVSTEYPNEYLVIGDNAMEKYGFGERLLNVQDYNKETVLSRIKGYASGLVK